MKMMIVTTITTLIDADTMAAQHSIHVDDQDKLSQGSPADMAAVLIDAANAMSDAVKQQFPNHEDEPEPPTPIKRADKKKAGA